MDATNSEQKLVMDKPKKFSFKAIKSNSFYEGVNEFFYVGDCPGNTKDGLSPRKFVLVLIKPEDGKKEARVQQKRGFSLVAVTNIVQRKGAGILGVFFYVIRRGRVLHRLTRAELGTIYYYDLKAKVFEMRTAQIIKEQKDSALQKEREGRVKSGVRRNFAKRLITLFYRKR